MPVFINNSCSKFSLGAKSFFGVFHFSVCGIQRFHCIRVQNPEIFRKITTAIIFLIFIAPNGKLKSKLCEEQTGPGTGCSSS